MADRSRVGIVTGLVAEAATIADCGHRVAVSAADPARAAQAADAMVAGGAGLLVSYGLAAGLDPRLGPGALLLPETIVAREGEIEPPSRGGIRDQLHRLGSFRREEEDAPPPPSTDDHLQVDRATRQALADGLGEAVEGGVLAGLDRPVMHTDQKLTLFAETMARAADMESHVVARAAAAAGVPFVAIRVVGDPSNRAIPRAALAGLGEDGRVAGGAVARALLLRPWECIDMMALALDTGRAMRRLRRVGRRAGPLLASL